MRLVLERWMSGASQRIGTGLLVTVFLGGCNSAVVQEPVSGEGTTPEAQRYAAAVCDVALPCACDPDEFGALWPASVEDCRKAVEVSYTNAERLAQTLDLEFDPSCFEIEIEAIADYSCTEWSGRNAACLVFVGGQAAGEPCGFPRWVPLVQDCGPSLSCVDGFCREPEPPMQLLQPGDRCTPEPASFDRLGRCPPGYLCDNHDSLQCIAIRQNGEPCFLNQCGEQLYCAPTDGAPLLSSAARGVCRGTASVGASCEHLDGCGRVARCESGACVLPDPLPQGEACYTLELMLRELGWEDTQPSGESSGG